MKELVDLIEAWHGIPSGTPTVLATVVATSGSTYRRPGARMLLTSAGWVAGSISGGCLEGDLVQSAFARTASGPVLVTYDATADEDILWGFGLGCNGLVQVLLERLPSDGGILRKIAEAVSARRTLTMATVISEGPRLGERKLPFDGSGAASERLGVEPADAGPRTSAANVYGWGEAVPVPRLEFRDGLTYFVETIFPPRPLVIVGAGHDALPLVAAAKALGWHVTVLDWRPGYADRRRFEAADVVVAAPIEASLGQLDLDSRAAVVVMAHHYLNDTAALRWLLDSSVGYIGMLGPMRRTQRMLDELRAEGFSPSGDSLKRVHAPIGLDLGAEGPDEIALAIVAEIQAFFKGRAAGHLTGRTASLHEPGPVPAPGPRGESARCSVSA